MPWRNCDRASALEVTPPGAWNNQCLPQKTQRSQFPGSSWSGAAWGGPGGDLLFSHATFAKDAIYLDESHGPSQLAAALLSQPRPSAVHQHLPPARVVAENAGQDDAGDVGLAAGAQLGKKRFI